MKYALITVIENNETNINNTSGQYVQKRMYESEAIICFTKWRENGGWLKDIPIYAYCPTKNKPSKDTIKKLEALNVVYIEQYIVETDNYFCGYWNIPLIGQVCENTLKEDIFIHIDLDMYLIKPLPEYLLNTVMYDNSIVICGQYDEYCSSQQRQQPPNWKRPFDTGFIVSHRDSGFYKIFYKTLKELTITKGDKVWNKYMNDRPLHDLEENAIDKLVNTMDNPRIIGIEKYQIGEWYTPVDKLTDEELSNVYFWHEHIIVDPIYDRVQEKIKYFKRMRNVNEK